MEDSAAGAISAIYTYSRYREGVTVVRDQRARHGVASSMNQGGVASNIAEGRFRAQKITREKSRVGAVITRMELTAVSLSLSLSLLGLSVITTICFVTHTRREERV